MLKRTPRSKRTPQRRIDAVRRCQQRKRAGRAIAQIEYGGEFITLLLRLGLLDEAQVVDEAQAASRTAAINAAATALVHQLETRALVIEGHDSVAQKYILTG